MIKYHVSPTGNKAIREWFQLRTMISINASCCFSPPWMHTWGGDIVKQNFMNLFGLDAWIWYTSQVSNVPRVWGWHYPIDSSQVGGLSQLGHHSHLKPPCSAPLYSPTRGLCWQYPKSCDLRHLFCLFIFHLHSTGISIFCWWILIDSYILIPSSHALEKHGLNLLIFGFHIGKNNRGMGL